MSEYLCDAAYAMYAITYTIPKVVAFRQFRSDAREEKELVRQYMHESALPGRVWRVAVEADGVVRSVMWPFRWTRKRFVIVI